MARKQPEKTALILNCAPPGVDTEPLWEGFVSSALKRYTALFTLNASDILDCSPANVFKVTDGGDDISARPVLFPRLHSQHHIREHGAPLLSLLASLNYPDLYVCGDFDAVRLAARLALWCRENAVQGDWTVIPCCPLNSVPFMDINPGFGSALAYCTAIGADLLQTCQRNAMTSPVGLLHIRDDHYGWLSAGTAALLSRKLPVLCILPDQTCDRQALAKALWTSLAKYSVVLIILGESPAPETPTTVSHFIEKTFQCRVATQCVQPRALIPSAYCARQDRKLSAAAGRAAVRLGRAARQHILVVNRFKPGSAASLDFLATPLLEAVHAVRRPPDAWYRPKTLKVSNTLADMLSGFTR